MQNGDDNFTPKIRFKLLILAILSFVTLILAAIFVIMLSLQNLTGISSTTLILGTCPSTYYTTKYREINKILITVFITAVLSIFLQIAISVLVFTPLFTKTIPNQTRIGMAYILTSVHMLSILIGFSKFLAFHMDLNTMGSTCTIEYSQIIITVSLSISSAEMLTSLLQYIFLLIVTEQARNHMKEESIEYKEVFNLTNTVQNIQNSKEACLPQTSKKQQYNQVIRSEGKLQAMKKDQQRYTSNQISMKPQAFQAQRESFIHPDYNRNNSIYQEEESLKSIMKLQNLALGKKANNPGPISTANRMQESEKVYKSQGYLSYIRKMNQNQANHSSDKQGELIAVIRGKYSK